MKISSLIACLLAVGTTAACATSPSAGMAQGSLPEGAAVAAFRTVFETNASALKSDAATYCIAMVEVGTRRDPDQSVVASLGGAGPAVVQASRCRVSERVLDGAGRPALLFTVERLSCSAEACVVRAGYFEGNLSAQTNTYTLRNMDGRWTVDPRATVTGPVS